ncbi:MAG: hypothetical protein DWQ48_11195 [Bacteroidetes bacterium]|nr:MAG: hypothetical protein DWQ48_11195 [Bacteroidota bacterium]
MKRDFTLDVYSELIDAIGKNYPVLTYEKFTELNPVGRSYVLRHDVDLLPYRSVEIARLESGKGIQGTYYFRIVPQSFDVKAIREIADMGHEIGYHYEDLALCNGNFEKAYEQFQRNLEKIRMIYPVRTICMHGSPLSKWDNLKLWDVYDYRNHGIISEPYFDTDFKKVFYITDTSRSWNAGQYSIRDKVNDSFRIGISSTYDLIEKIRNNELPMQVMQNVHPQRWTNQLGGWTKELIWQNVKNVAKGILNKLKS